MSTTRETLPPRRSSVTHQLWWQGRPFQLSIGLHADGRPAEIFITGTKSGTDIDALYRDSAIVLSVALQYGVPLATLSKSISRDHMDMASSIIGLAVDLLASEAGSAGEERQ